MRFQVTAWDIRYGQPGAPDRCAVARAMHRMIGYRFQVEVYPAELNSLFYAPFPDGGYEAKQMKLPAGVCEFARRFDAGLPVEPLEFDLDGPWDAPSLEDPSVSCETVLENALV